MGFFDGITYHIRDGKCYFIYADKSYVADKDGIERLIEPEPPKIYDVKYRVRFSDGKVDGVSTLLYEGDDYEVAKSFIPHAYKPGGMNGGPQFSFATLRKNEDGDETITESIYVWQESFLIK